MATPPTIVNFAGNDYLGLARHPRLVDAAHRAACLFGISPTSSRWGLGWTEVHEQLEQQLALFLQCEAVCLLGQAYLGALVFLTTVSGEFETVYCDELCHSSLILGAQAAGLRVERYIHLDAADLRQRLELASGNPPIIATDTVFGISGELAPLAELHELTQLYGGQLLLDDAHGLFTLGEYGRGALHHAGLTPDRTTIIGSMSKGLGTGGGFLAGQRTLVERFRRSAPVSSSTPLATPLAAASLEGLRLLEEQPELLESLRRNTAHMRDLLAEQQLTTVSDQTPILALEMADARQAEQLARHLMTHGIRVPYFQYPSEPRHHLLRVIARSCYTTDELARFAAALHTFR